MSKPTETEIIQEANKLGYAYESDCIFITLISKDKYIKIVKTNKTYISYFYDQYTDYIIYKYINCEEHKLITKILTYLGGL